MAIYVKDKKTGVYPALPDYKLFADASAELTGPDLTTETDGDIECAPGSKAYCLDGTLWILSTAGVWTQVVNGLTSF